MKINLFDVETTIDDSYRDCVEIINELAFENREREILKFIKDKRKTSDEWMLQWTLFDADLSLDALKIMIKDPLIRGDLKRNIMSSDSYCNILTATIRNCIDDSPHVRNESFLKDYAEQKIIYEEFKERISLLIDSGVDVNNKDDFGSFFVHDMSMVAPFIPDFLKFLLSKNVEITDADFVKFISKQDLSYKNKVPDYMEDICSLFPNIKHADFLLRQCFKQDPNDGSKISYYNSVPSGINEMRTKSLTIDDYDVQENPFLIEFFVKYYKIDLNKSGTDLFGLMSFEETAQLLFNLGLNLPEEINKQPEFIKNAIIEKEKKIILESLNSPEVENEKVRKNRL